MESSRGSECDKDVQSEDPENDHETALPSREPGFSRGMKTAAWLVVLGFLAAVIYPTLRKQQMAADRTKALSNIRQIGLSLFEFESEFGSFPNVETVPAVKAYSKTPLTLGSGSSNQLFRQLIAHGLKSEKPFHAKIPGSRRPDDLFEDDAHALAPGECGYTYVMGLNSRMDPGTPVVFTPAIPNTLLCDPNVFSGRAVVLRVDNSATAMSVMDDGRVNFGGGRAMLDGSQPWWNGKAPDIKWHEPLR